MTEFKSLRRMKWAECAARIETEGKSKSLCPYFFSATVIYKQGPQPAEFYNSGISKLVVRWDKCLNRGGDYVEK
jgi:hypothetical protein